MGAKIKDCKRSRLLNFCQDKFRPTADGIFYIAQNSKKINKKIRNRVEFGRSGIGVQQEISNREDTTMPYIENFGFWPD
jgi:hypothetical protein